MDDDLLQYFTEEPIPRKKQTIDELLANVYDAPIPIPKPPKPTTIPTPPPIPTPIVKKIKVNEPIPIPKKSNSTNGMPPQTTQLPKPQELPQTKKIMPPPQPKQHKHIEKSTIPKHSIPQSRDQPAKPHSKHSKPREQPYKPLEQSSKPLIPKMSTQIPKMKPPAIPQKPALTPAQDLASKPFSQLTEKEKEILKLQQLLNKSKPPAKKPKEQPTKIDKNQAKQQVKVERIVSKQQQFQRPKETCHKLPPPKLSKEEHYDLNDPFIDDKEEALDSSQVREYEETIVKCRVKKRAKDNISSEEASEVGFEEIQRQEEKSRLFGQLDDEREWKYILKEKQKEKKQKHKKHRDQ